MWKQRGKWGAFCLALLGMFLLGVLGCANPEEEELAQKLQGRAEGRILPDREDYYQAFVLDKNHAWVVGSRGVILSLTDRGQKITLLPSGVKKALYDVSFVDAQNGLVVGQEGLILKTTDGGRSWRQIPVELPLEEWQAAMPHFFALSRGKDPNKIWVVGPVGTIIHSKDGGETWEDLSLPPPPEQFGGRTWDLTLNGVHFVSDSEGWVVGEFGKILHTTDGGHTWEKQENVLELPKFTRPDLTEEEALRRRVPPLYLEDLYIFDVAFLNPEEGYIAAETGILLETKDGGQTWTNVSKGQFNTLLSVTALPINGDSLAFATGVLGTMARKGEGKKWRYLEEVRQEVHTWVRATSFDQNGEFGVACGGKGTILLTHDGGRIWEQVPAAKLRELAS